MQGQQGTATGHQWAPSLGRQHRATSKPHLHEQGPSENQEIRSRAAPHTAYLRGLLLLLPGPAGFGVGDFGASGRGRGVTCKKAEEMLPNKETKFCLRHCLCHCCPYSPKPTLDNASR